MILIRAFFPGTRGKPQDLHTYLFSSMGILTFVLIEIFLASSVYRLDNRGSRLRLFLASERSISILSLAIAPIAVLILP